jgi:heat shock protein HtpX
MNMLKTVFLMTLMMVVLLLIGDAVAGEQGLIIAFLFSFAMNVGMYWFSDKMVLMMYKAREARETEVPELFRIVRKLSTEAQIPMPKVYVIPGETPNAFATGRNPDHAAVAATEGILRLLSEDELEGVIAHELAHVKHRDILTGTIVATMAGTITLIARMAGWALMFGGGRRSDRDSGNTFAELALLILAPLAAVLIQLAISRSREFAADEGGAKLSHKPLGLANALRKLERGNETHPLQNAQPVTSHLFIVNPLRGRSLMKLFSTHPPIEERIARLEQMATGGI